MAPHQHTAADQIISDLQAAVGPERWRVWFEGSTDIRVEADRVAVGVANLFISDYLKSHFAKHLQSAVRARVGRDLPIAWYIQPDLFQKRRATNLADEAEALEQLQPQPAEAAKATFSASRPVPRFTLDNFVVGPCNQMAYAAARSAIHAPGKDFHPLFIHGGCGLGKTHLLYGILHALEARSNLRVVCLSAEQFTNRYLAGVRTGRLDAFRHHYRHLDILAIDDVHFLGGKPATQEEFLHTFDEFEGSGRLIILASDAHPAEIQAVQHRLISRWVSGLVVHLSPPDVQTRRRLVQAKAHEIGRTLPDDVVHLVADRIQGSVRDLEGALTRILAYAALLKQPATLALARQALEGLVATRPLRTGVREIETAVAEFFGVSVEDIHSRRKARLVSLARQVTMVLAREMTDLSLAEIARLLGGKNHTTVLAACRKWHRLVRDGAEIAWTDKTDRRALSAETLLAHLKERLRR